MADELIYDLGLHHGDDTDFICERFRVIALEANPEFCRLAPGVSRSRSASAS